MAREYSIAHAKDHRAEAVRAAEAGEPVTLTRRGRPVAVIVSEAEYRRLAGPGGDFWTALGEFRATFDNERDGIEPEYWESLRDRGPGRDVDLGVWAMFRLDANVLSETLRPQPDSGVMHGLRRHSRQVATAAPVIHEILFGALRFPLGAKRKAVLHEIEHVSLKTLDVLPCDRRAAEWHARQRARLVNEGRTPANVDGRIAAIAAISGLTLVTHNVMEVTAFEGLGVEDWFAG